MTVSVTGFTAARSQEIEDSAIISGSVNGSGNLILLTRAGTPINAGHVVGPTGANGNGLIICTSTTRPSSPTQGMMIYETNTKRIFVYNSAAWKWVWSNDLSEYKVNFELEVTADSDAVSATPAAWPTGFHVDVLIPYWATLMEAEALIGQASQQSADGNTELSLRIGTLQITHKRIIWPVSATRNLDINFLGSRDVSSIAGTTQSFRVEATRMSGTGALRCDAFSVCHLRGCFY